MKLRWSVRGVVRRGVLSFLERMSWSASFWFEMWLWLFIFVERIHDWRSVFFGSGSAFTLRTMGFRSFSLMCLLEYDTCIV